MNTKWMKHLGFAMLLFVVTPAALRADDDGCSTGSLKGAFAYSVRGTTPANAQFAAAGRIVFNGNGQVSTVRTLSNGGTIVKNDIGSGTYTLGSDCRGSFSIVAAGLGQLLVDIVLSGKGSQLRGIVTNPGFVLALEGSRQDR